MPAESSVQGEPLMLLPHSVTDLEGFVAPPDLHLVVLFKEPEQVAALLWERLKKPLRQCGIPSSHLRRERVDP